jgi:tetratricopeptide (TPR) repeat protein
MKSPSQIAAESVRDELYARKRFAELISLPARDFRLAIENDPCAQTEFMARHILCWLDDHHCAIAPEDGLQLVNAAQTAARQAEPHVRCRVEKELANVFRYLRKFAAAEAALKRASAIAERTMATDLNLGTVEFGLVALCDDTGAAKEAEKHVNGAIRAFEANGAHDRAYSVRLYDAFIKFRTGNYLFALGAYQDAARRARSLRSHNELAWAYYNMAHCYKRLSDFLSARRYFDKAARAHRHQGQLILEAKALRCVARMSIRIHGEAAIPEMDRAKHLYLAFDRGGEVCRSTIAVIEELLEREASMDLTPYCRQLRDEAFALGILPIAHKVLCRLNEAARLGRVTMDMLDETWEAFGPLVTHSTVSGLATVQN